MSHDTAKYYAVLLNKDGSPWAIFDYNVSINVSGRHAKIYFYGDDLFKLIHDLTYAFKELGKAEMEFNDPDKIEISFNDKYYRVQIMQRQSATPAAPADTGAKQRIDFLSITREMAGG